MEQCLSAHWRESVGRCWGCCAACTGRAPRQTWVPGCRTIRLQQGHRQTGIELIMIIATATRPGLLPQIAAQHPASHAPGLSVCTWVSRERQSRERETSGLVPRHSKDAQTAAVRSAQPYPVASVRQQVDLVAQHADARLIVAAPPECAALCLDKGQPHAVGRRREERPQVGQGV